MIKNKISYMLKIAGFTLFLMMILHAGAYSQYTPAQYDSIEFQLSKNNSQSKNFFNYGFTSCINLTDIIGIGAEAGLSNNMSLYMSLGLGIWGRHLNTAIRLYDNNYPGVFYSAGFSTAAGVLDEIFIEDKENNDSIGIKFLRTFETNLSVGYSFLTSRNKYICIETGYSFSLTPKAYKINSDKKLSDFYIYTLRRWQPGGFFISVSYFFT